MGLHINYQGRGKGNGYVWTEPDPEPKPRRITAQVINDVYGDLDITDVPTPELLTMSGALDRCLPAAADRDAVEAIKRITGRINAVLKSRANGARANGRTN